MKIGSNLSSSLCLLARFSWAVFCHQCYTFVLHLIVYRHESTQIPKIADDTTVLRLITNCDESEYRDQVNKHQLVQQKQSGAQCKQNKRYDCGF